jgi:hypothetical protein
MLSSTSNRISLSLATAVASSVLATSTPAQQVPAPTTAAEVPGPTAGTDMMKSYVRTIGRMAYVWGWPLVNAAKGRGLLQSTRTRTAGRCTTCRLQSACDVDRLHCLE